MTKRHTKMDCSYDGSIVISGISGKYPNSENVIEFKEHLYNMESMITSTEPRWPEGLIGLPPKMGILKCINKLDAAYFNISPLQANNMEIMHRISLEVSAECLYDAGYSPEMLAGKKIGVFMGTGSTETEEILVNDLDNTSGYPLIGCSKAMFANRLNYAFDLKGPSFACDSACSSTAIAFHQAYLAMRSGVIDGAIVGGLNLCLKPNFSYQFNNQKMLSPDGILRCFDKDANGYVRSETVASMFLQKKDDAKRIYAEVVHVKSNTDGGNKIAVTFPSRTSQAELMKSTFEQAGIDPTCVTYVEAHGTGTPVGDPEECSAIAEVFLKTKREKPLLVGSVKSNCGHAEAASAMTAYTKIGQIFETGLIPPNLNFETANPKINALVDETMQVVTKTTPFEGEYICSNCFGFGGSNVHAIFKRHDKPPSLSKHTEIPRLALFYGRSEESLYKSLKEIGEPLKSPEYYALLQELNAVATPKMTYKGFTIVNSTEPTVNYVKKVPSEKRPIWFVYSGVGSQWPKMANRMMNFNVFAESIRRSADLLKPLGIDLYSLIMEDSLLQVNENSIISSFVSIGSVQIALTDLLKSLGIAPDGIIGHSVGEMCCSYADGCFTAEETIMAIYYRGKAIIDNIEGLVEGGMAAIGSTWEDALEYCTNGIIRACDNSIDSVTISGPKEEIKKCCKTLNDKGIFAKEVNCFGVPFHSNFIAPAGNSLREYLKKLVPIAKKRSSKWISTSIQKEHWNEPLAQYCSSEYHVNNFISPVLFNEAVKEIPQNALVIEISSHCILNAILKKSLPSDCECFGLMKRNHPNNSHFLLENIGRLYSSGVNVQIQNLYPKVEFPVPRNTPPLGHLVAWDHSEDRMCFKWNDFNCFANKNEIEFEVDLSNAENSYLYGHCIDGRILYPGTGYLVLAWKALAKLLVIDHTELPVQFEEIRIHRATILSEKDPTVFKISINVGQGQFEIKESNFVIASGIIKQIEPFEASEIADIKGEEVLQTADIYKECNLRGYNYGPTFRLLTSSNLEGTKGTIRWEERWESFMDAMLHSSILRMESRQLFVPVSIQSARINPFLHKNFQVNQEVPIKVNKYISVTVSGGVEIQRVHFNSAPRKPSRQSATLESYQFIPYINKVDNEGLTEYTKVCSKLLRKITEDSGFSRQRLDKIISRKTPLASEEVVEGYLNSPSKNHTLLKLLTDILECKATCSNLSQAIENVRTKNNTNCQEDILNATMLNQIMFRTCIDVALENILAYKIKICELTNTDFIYNHIFNYFEKFNPFRHISYTIANNISDSEHFEDVAKINWDHVTENQELSGFDIIICRNIVTDRMLKALKKSMNSNGFLIIVQRTSLTPAETFLREFKFDIPTEKPEKELDSLFTKIGFTIICKNSCKNTGTVYLLKVNTGKIHPANMIELGVENYDEWVDHLKKTLKEHQEKINNERIWVTSNNQNSGILGLVNCLRVEPGGDMIRCILNDSKNIKNGSSLLSKDLVMNVNKAGQLGSFRHISISEENLIETTSCYSNVKFPGDLTSFTWYESSLKYTPKELHGHVYYSALNFKDVLLATARITSDIIPSEDLDKDCLLGFEFSGRNNVGERIMGMIANKGLATTVEIDPGFSWKVPDKWTMQQAATIPVVYSTVYYSLIMRARIKKGDSILIHSGSGGVGQAAIRVALSMGLTVYTTVGNEDKKSFLKKMFPQLKDENFSDSRSLKFEEDIMKHTNGRGVDHVLNSLSEEKLQASARCLAMNGHFLEIGKYDMSQNSALGMRLFSRNISFHGILLDSIFGFKNREAKREVARLVAEGIENNVVQPLQSTLFDKSQIEDAFRFMASGKHVGKVLIKMRDEEQDLNFKAPQITMKAIPKAYCNPERTFIITGGLGGFGLELANWLIKQGAKKLILTSRTGPRTGYQIMRLKLWESSGITVKVMTYDASNENQCKQLLEEASALGTVGGIFNLAMVLKDAFFENQTTSNFYEVGKPKALGTKNLDKFSRNLCPELQWFVCFSSVSCGRGNPGQTNYGYANSVMERICEHRVKAGLHGLAIQWGVIGDVGVVQEQMGDKTIEGYLPQKIDSCLLTLEKFLTQTEPVVSSFVSGNRDDSKSKSSETTISLSKSIAHILGIKDLSNIDPDSTLENLGLDSLMTVEAQKTLERGFDIVLTQEQIRKLSFTAIFQLEQQNTASSNKSDFSDTNIEDIKNFNLDNFILPTEPFVHLNSIKTGNPIFIFPPTEGNIRSCIDLAQCLSSPVIGLQHTISMNETNLQIISEAYLQIIKSIQPKGPYNLIGYSLGTIQAYEISLKLKAEGENVDTLVFLDGSPSMVLSQFNIYAQRLEDKEKKVVGLSYILNETLAVERTKVLRLLADIKNYDDQVNFASEILYNASDKRHNIESIRSSLEIHYSKLIAYHDYQQETKLSNDIILIKAKQSLSVTTNIEEDYDLKKITTGKVHVHTIEGAHSNFLIGFGASTIVEILQRCHNYNTLTTNNVTSN